MKPILQSVKDSILKQLQKQQATMAQIARDHNVSRVYVRNVALANNITWYSQPARAVRSPGLAERKARAERVAVRSAHRAKRLAELAETWKAGKTCTEIAALFGYDNQKHAASLIANLRRSHGEQLLPYRRPNRKIAHEFQGHAQSPSLSDTHPISGLH